MIKSIAVTNYTDQTLLLELENPEQSGFLITDISGLGPPKATINMSPNGSLDGSIFNTAKISERNIVISLKFIGDDVETLRQKTYKYFPIKSVVKLQITTNNRKCMINGIVESNEPTIFDPQCGAQISMLCPDPYFVDCGELAEKSTVFYGISPLFSMPFSNDDLTEKLISFGEIDNRSEQLIKYEGDANVGMVIIIKALGTAKNVTLYNSFNKTILRLDTAKLQALTGSGIKVGDEIVISTTVESRTVTLLRDGIKTNILNCLGKFPQWIMLTPGDNIMACAAEEGFQNLMITMSYKTIYEGV